MDLLNNVYGWNLQHAENGNEYHIKELGYWLDGYDKEKNIVVEYDEPKHKYYDKQKDIKRQQNIIQFLKCEFWRYNEKEDKLYCASADVSKPILISN